MCNLANIKKVHFNTSTYSSTNLVYTWAYDTQKTTAVAVGKFRITFRLSEDTRAGRAKKSRCINTTSNQKWYECRLFSH